MEMAMRIVEREGTGIGSTLNSFVKPTVLAVSLTLLGATQAQAQVNVAQDSCGAVSVATAQDGHIYSGKGTAEASYALFGLSPVSDGTVDSAGEGTGINSAGEGTGAPSDNDPGGAGTNSAGEGTGETVDPGTNAAGEGTGAPQESGSSSTNYWGWAEIVFTGYQNADVIIYSDVDGALIEQEVYSNVAVSGSASGNGCDRE